MHVRRTVWKVRPAGIGLQVRHKHYRSEHVPRPIWEHDHTGGATPEVQPDRDTAEPMHILRFDVGLHLGSRHAKRSAGSGPCCERAGCRRLDWCGTFPFVRACARGRARLYAREYTEERVKMSGSGGGQRASIRPGPCSRFGPRRARLVLTTVFCLCDRAPPAGIIVAILLLCMCACAGVFVAHEASKSGSTLLVAFNTKIASVQGKIDGIRPKSAEAMEPAYAKLGA